MPAESPIVEVLAAAAEALRRSDSRWYLFGAQAVAIWGQPRMSADVDITAAVEAPYLDFVHAMQKAGFDPRVNDWEGFLERTRVIPFLHREQQLPLDVVLAGPGLEEEFLERAVPVTVAGVTIPVITPEDLIITKVLAGRPKDIEDVRGIVRERLATLDLQRVRTVLATLEQALSRSDLLSELERLLSAARGD